MMNNEPVAWLTTRIEDDRQFLDWIKTGAKGYSFIPLYTHSVKTLSKEDVRKVWMSLPYDPDNAPYIFAEAILRKAQE